MEDSVSAPRPIKPQSTDTAAFVGLAESGPTEPTLVAGFSEFTDIFGAPVDGSYLAHATRSFFDNGGRRLYIARVASGCDSAEVDDYLGDPTAPAAERTGLAALEDLDDVSLVAIPDEARREPVDLSPVTLAVVEHCERKGDRMALVSAPAGVDDPKTLRPPRDTSFGAFYFPWIEVHAADAADGHARTSLLTPPTGAVAGLIARFEHEHGVHKAPAGEALRGVLGVETDVRSDLADVLNPRGVNTLREFPNRGILVWGARTMSSDPEWKYVPIRRYFLYLERSLEKGTQWAVFEPNDEPLWSRVRGQIEGFLADEWRRGAVQGSKPEEAFFVRCDRSTMTQADIDEGRLIVHIGFAPLKPAEFVVIKIQQLAGRTRP